MPSSDRLQCDQRITVLPCPLCFCCIVSLKSLVILPKSRPSIREKVFVVSIPSAFHRQYCSGIVEDIKRRRVWGAVDRVAINDAASSLLVVGRKCVDVWAVYECIEVHGLYGSGKFSSELYSCLVLVEFGVAVSSSSCANKWTLICKQGEQPLLKSSKS
jgi:hypothetical protein